MHNDGEIDYSKYGLAELEEALETINKHQYPKNYANLCAAYELLTASLAKSDQPDSSDANVAMSHASYWDRLMSSPLVFGAAGAFFLWWAYAIFNQPDACQPGTKLIGFIVSSICENFGNGVAAGIPFILGLYLLAHAGVTARRSVP